MENKKFSLQDLVEQVAAQSSLTKKFTEEFLRELVSVIEEYLEKDGVVKVKGLGTFKLIWNDERKSVNVTTGEELILPAHYKVSFTAESSVLDQLNGGSNPSVMVETTAPEPVAGPAPAPTREASPAPVAEPASASGRSELPKPFFIPIPGKEEASAPVEPSAPEPETAPMPEPAPEPASEPASTPAPEPAPVPVAEAPSAGPEEVRLDNAVPSDQHPMERVRKKGHGWIWWLLSLLLLGGLGWYFRDSWYPQARSRFDTLFPQWAVQDTVASDTVYVELPVFAEGDSINWDEDSTSVAEEYEGELPAEAEQPAESVEERRQRLLSSYTPSMAQSAPVRESVIVIDGSRLTLFALRAYGHKDFWVYIYDANRDVLTSPGSLAKGMSLKIPDLDALLVDPDNADCLQKAAELAAQY
ncbi:MAG: HU family DNA-binding protein [Paludibacteraceae bacterium]|nr:HU family DNA-binding protein [Paludibacteraceae bacterium]